MNLGESTSLVSNHSVYEGLCIIFISTFSALLCILLKSPEFQLIGRTIVKENQRHIASSSER